MAHDLHQSLKSEVIAKSQAHGAEIALAKLAWGKADTKWTLHVAPNTYSMSGIQVPDLLSYLGFSRQKCMFVAGGDGYCKEIQEGFNPDAFGVALRSAYQELAQAQRLLDACGYPLPQPEGWGYFLGKEARGRERPSVYGDGHTSAKRQKMRATEDDTFRFVFSWIENGQNDKGWTVHYRPRHPPLSIELQGVLKFLGISQFEKCPEFDFEPCYWRYTPFAARSHQAFDSNAEIVGRWFDAHDKSFSQGIKALLTAQATMEEVGMSFLPFERPDLRRVKEIDRHADAPAPAAKAAAAKPEAFDVAISFAGTDRKHAEKLAETVKAAGYNVFYDRFYPEDLWGKDLVEFFHEIYSKRSRYCVMFVSKEYLNREWTVHERRSAQERMLKEKGNEYILPIKVENIDLPGLPSTIGYVDIGLGIDNIAQTLIKKLAVK